MKLIIGLLIGLAIVVGGEVASATVRDNHSVGRVCFSKATWSAHDGDRPCVSVKMYEDGSYDAAVHPASAGYDPSVHGSINP